MDTLVKKMFLFMALTINYKIEIIFYAAFILKLSPKKQKLFDIIHALFKLADKR